MNELTKSNLLKMGTGLLLVFVLFALPSFSNKAMFLGLKKAKFPLPTSTSESVEPKTQLAICSEAKTTTINAIAPEEASIKSDSLQRERILLIGDSQLDGLRKPILKSCIANNHELVATVIWYGSSTKNWSISDTLSTFIKKYKPTYVIIALGLNELFFNDLDDRRKYTDNLLATIKKHKLKHYWIGPAAWKKDLGICDILAEKNGELFYPSHKLTLERRADKRHPSNNASKIWFQKVAQNMSSLKHNRIDFTKNADSVKINNAKSPTIILKPFYY
ncbi:MAG: hypothetical protein RLZZ175_2505 [Bacteroidota bacterium]|jgi:lysophospholipase L1-like esterase